MKIATKESEKLSSSTWVENQTWFKGVNPSLILSGSLLLIAVVTWFTYHSSLWNGFVNYDDNLYIYENSDIQNLSWNNILGFFKGNIGQYPPLTMIAFSLIYHFIGPEPTSFHVVSLVLHVFNSLLVFLFIYHFDRKVLAALVAGLLFGLHPMHVESVAWATELKDLLYTAFFLGGLLAYQSYQQLGNQRKYLVIALVLFILSCLSKGMAVVFPLVLLLMDFYNAGKVNKNQWLEKIPFFIMSLIWGLLTLLTQQSMGALDGGTSITVFERLFIFSQGILFYLTKAIYPLQLSAFYPFPLVTGSGLPVSVYLSILGVIVPGVMIYFAKKYRRILVFGSLFFLLNLILVLQILPVGMAITADRYFYLSSVGLFFILSYFFDELIHHQPRLRASVLSISVFIVAGLAVLTHTQAKVWENSVTLWNQVLENPKPYRGYALAYTNRGDAYADRNDFDAAIQDYGNALEVNPEYVDALNNRGMIKGLKQEYAEAKLDFDAALVIRPDFAKAYNNRGNANRFLGDAQAALDDFSKAISIKPDYLDAYINRGVMLYLVGDSLAACRDWKKVRDAGSSAADQLLKDYCR
ncbi:MAG: tetratricopeptide repeat protein [Bacteroidales bacterium]|nr:tetratricopeptide repeat protein [Bacteroidales bacterium]